MIIIKIKQPVFIFYWTGHAAYNSKPWLPYLKWFLADFKRSVLAKLDTILQKQDEGLVMLRTLVASTRVAGGADVLVDVLPKPAETTEDIAQLCAKLEDESIKKKMVSINLLK